MWCVLSIKMFKLISETEFRVFNSQHNMLNIFCHIQDGLYCFQNIKKRVSKSNGSAGWHLAAVWICSCEKDPNLPSPLLPMGNQWKSILYGNGWCVYERWVLKGRTHWETDKSCLIWTQHMLSISICQCDVHGQCCLCAGRGKEKRASHSECLK